LGLDRPGRSAHQNKSLNFIVSCWAGCLRRDTDLAVLRVPRSLPRVVPVPQEGSGMTFVLLSNIVAEFIALLFPGMEVRGCFPFRVTRNSDLFVDDEEVDDLRRALEGELAQRRYGASVRLETSVDCPADVADFLLQRFGLTPLDLYRVAGPVNLNRLSAVYELALRPDLKYAPFVPALPANHSLATSLFDQLREGDVLLHHPFQSFAPVLDFLRLAANDPQVLAIKQTLYRTGSDSPIVDALVTASHNGKDVTAIIELRARFDEEANIGLANRLQEAGVHVVYGVVSYKTHAKMIMVVRARPTACDATVIWGQGNCPDRWAYHYGLLTCDRRSVWTCTRSSASPASRVPLGFCSSHRYPALRLLELSPRGRARRRCGAAGSSPHERATERR
jgi:polyphosphate kinase